MLKILNNFTFDFLTNLDSSQEMTNAPSSVVVNSHYGLEYCVVTYGTNLPVSSGGMGRWEVNSYGDTDHQTYLMKPNLWMKCKGSVSRSNLNSTLTYKVRLLQDGFQVEETLKGNLNVPSGVETFELSNTFQYPYSFKFTNVRIQHASAYLAQIQIEEWYNGQQIGGTIWVPVSHNLIGRINPPKIVMKSLQHGINGEIITNKNQSNYSGSLSESDRSYVAFKDGLTYGYGGVGSTFANSDNDIDIITEFATVFSSSISSTSSKKGRFALASKNEFGNVTKEPHLQDYIFDFSAPKLTWKSKEVIGSVVHLKGTAEDLGSGIESLSVLFKSKTSGHLVVAAKNGIEYTGKLNLVEGQNEIEFLAYDNAKNKASLTTVLSLDTGAPLVTFQTVETSDGRLNFAEDMVVYKKSAIIELTIEDTSLLHRATLSVNGNTTEFLYNNKRLESILETIILQEGSNEIIVEAADKEDNVSHNVWHLIYVKKDESLPEITISHPVFDSWQNNQSIIFSGTATDEVGISRVTVSLATSEGGNPYRVTTATLNGNSWEATITSAVDGVGFVVVTAFNSSGRTTLKDWRVKIGSLLPKVYFTNSTPSTSRNNEVTIYSFGQELISYLTKHVIKVNGIIQYDVKYQRVVKDTQPSPEAHTITLVPGMNTVEALYYNASGLYGVAEKQIERLSADILITATPVTGSVVTKLPFYIQVAVESQIPLTFIDIDYISNKTASQVNSNVFGVMLKSEAISGSVVSYAYHIYKGYVGVDGQTINDIPTSNSVVRVVVHNQQSIETALFEYSMTTSANAPSVVMTSPVNGAVNVGATTPVSITFSQVMDTTSTIAAMEFQPSKNGQWSWQSGNKVAVFNHTEAFSGQQSLNIGTSASDINGSKLSNNYNLSFSVSSQPSVSSITPGGSGVGLDTEVVISFSVAMNELSLSNISLIEKNSKAVVTCGFSVTMQGNCSVVKLIPSQQLGYDTDYEVIVPFSVTSVAGLNISEHRQTFRTRVASGENEEDGKTIVLVPGLNGFSLPVNVTGVSDEASLRNYINGKLFNANAVGAIFRMDTSAGKWKVNVTGNSGRDFAYGEGMIINMNISSQQNVKFLGNPLQDSLSIEVFEGLNCIGLTRNVPDLNNMKDLIAALSRQLNQNETISYLFRVRASSLQKTPVGYALKNSVTHNGIGLNSGNGQIAGDAIIFNSSRHGYVSFHGDDWKD